MARRTFPIARVVADTGVPAPTIRHYARLGLLPPPRRSGPKRFLYDERHVRAVRLIRMLRTERRLPLTVIRKILPGLLRLGDDGLREAAWDAALHRQGADSADGRLVRRAEALFARRGFDRTSMTEIAAAVRMAKGSLYRRHPTKESLFFAVCDAAADRVADPGGKGDPEERLIAALRQTLTIFLDLTSGAARRRPGFARALKGVRDRLGRRGIDAPPFLGAALSRTLEDLEG